MKNISIKSIATFFSFLMILVSTAQYNHSNDKNVSVVKEFSFETFNRLQGKLINIETIEISEKQTRLELNNEILRQVNEYHQTEIDFDNELKKLKTAEKIFDWLTVNTDFDESDVDLLKKLSEDFTSKKFDNAISNLEIGLSKNDISAEKFNKYQSIVNGVKLIEHQYPGSFTSQATAKSWRCAFALAGLALAGASLVAGCIPAHASLIGGILCHAAVATIQAAANHISGLDYQDCIK
jgi:hypothetical protein